VLYWRNVYNFDSGTGGGSNTAPLRTIPHRSASYRIAREKKTDLYFMHEREVCVERRDKQGQRERLIA